METERLLLEPMQPDDLDALYPIFSDPDGWAHDPGSRHRDRATSASFIERAAARWSTDGLSYWTVRLRATGEVIGMGGVQRHRTGAWNLAYRLAVSQWGHGYATEMSLAAIAAAADIGPDAPVLAWIAESNTASQRVAERLGLRGYGLRTDRNDGVTRLAYADRPFDDFLRARGLVMPDFPGLGGESVTLEPLLPEHAEELAVALEEPAARLRTRYERVSRGRSDDGTQRWLNWVVRERATHRAVGYVQATVVGNTADVAWVIGTTYQGRGYAKEAARVMTSWLRGQDVATIGANVHPGNPASAAVARSIGLHAMDAVVDGEVRWEG